MREDATRTVTNLTGRPLRMSGKVKVLLWATFTTCVITNAATSFDERPALVPLLLGLLTTACAVALFAQHRRR